MGVGTGVTSTWMGGRGVAVTGAAVAGSAVGEGAASTVAAGRAQASMSSRPISHMQFKRRDRFMETFGDPLKIWYDLDSILLA